MLRNTRNLVLDIFDYSGNKVCSLYDCTSEVSGQAANVFVTNQRNGWKELSFTVPAKCHVNGRGEENFRQQYLINEYRIRLIDDYETDWYIISEPKITHSGFTKDIQVVAGHCSQILKTKNLSLEFSDDEGNNIGTCEQLLNAVLEGTGWSAGNVDTFYEKDRKTVKVRSLKASAKSGSFKLISMICDLFEAKPVYHGDTKTVDIVPMNPFSDPGEGKLPDVTKADGVIELHYGKNVTNIARTLDSTNMITRLYAYGSYGDKTNGYCGIDEITHKEHMYTLCRDLYACNEYYFSYYDEAGYQVVRKFCPSENVLAGTKLIYSTFDPASRLYIWNNTTEKAYPVSKGYPITREGSRLNDDDLLDISFCIAEKEDSLLDGEDHLDTTFFISERAASLLDEEGLLDISFFMSIEEGVSSIQDKIVGNNLVEYSDSYLSVDAQNWFSSVMDFTYYNDNGMLTDEMLQCIARYQREGVKKASEILEASADFNDTYSKVATVIGQVDYCRLAIKRIAREDGYLKIYLDTDAYKDGVIYRTDYDAKKDNQFKWRKAEAIKDNGDPKNDAASVIYMLHKGDTSYVDPSLLWKKIYIKDFDDEENPTVLTLWDTSPTTDYNVVTDRWYLFQTNNVNGLLGAYEVADESAKTALDSATKIVTVQHPVYFSNDIPFATTEDLNGYGWWWKKNSRELYFRYSDDGDTAWKKVFVSDIVPSYLNSTYFYNWKTARLYKAANGSWMLYDDKDTKSLRVAQLFSTVWRYCQTRTKYQEGIHQYYTVELTEDLAKGNYYIADEFYNYRLFTTTKNLHYGDKLVYDTTESWVVQTSNGIEETLETKGYRFDNVRYHPANIAATAIYEAGAINAQGGDVSGSGYRTNYLAAYPHIQYIVQSASAGSVVFFYTDQHSFISSMALSAISNSFVTPENTGFIRMSCSTVSKSLAIYTPNNSTAIIADDETYYYAGDSVGSGELKGVNPLVFKFADLSDKLYLQDQAFVAKKQEEMLEFEHVMTETLGDIYREGYWQKPDYVDGDEQKLYDDALENIVQLSKPEAKYTINFLDLYSSNKHSKNYGATEKASQVKWPDLNSSYAAHLIDEDLKINCWAFIDTVKKCYDCPEKTSITINTNLSTMSQHSFTDVMAHIASVASEMKGKDTIYSRAAAITGSGALAAERLQGAIDANRLLITGGSSTWYTDDNGNIVFVSADGNSAMTLTGNGFAIANAKDVYGEWVWRTFGTGDGFTADEIIAGYLSAERIEAGSITTDKIASSVGAELNLSSNKSIRLTVQEIVDEAIKDPIYQGPEPDDPYVGMLWLDTSESNLKRWDGQKWVLVTDNSEAMAAIRELSSDFTVTAGKISSSVKEVEHKLDQATGELRDQIKEANQKITPEAITQTVINSKEYSEMSMTANKINWLVKGGEDMSEMTLTDKLMSIFANEISLKANRVYRQEQPPVDGHANDLWVDPKTGYTYQLNADLPDEHLKVYVDDNLNLYWEHDPAVTDYSLNLESGTLFVEYADGSMFYFEIGIEEDSGILFTNGKGWTRVEDQDLATAYDLSTKIRNGEYSVPFVESTGITIKDNKLEINSLGLLSVAANGAVEILNAQGNNAVVLDKAGITMATGADMFFKSGTATTMELSSEGISLASNGGIYLLGANGTSAVSIDRNGISLGALADLNLLSGSSINLVSNNGSNVLSLNDAGIDISAAGHIYLKGTGDNNVVTIDSDGIALGTTAKFEVYSTNFVIDKDGNVTLRGKVTATEGSVGGWTINQNSLSSGEGATYVELNSDTNNEYAFWTGNQNASVAPFSVKRNGEAYITSLYRFKNYDSKTGEWSGAEKIDLRKSLWHADVAYNDRVTDISVSNNTLSITWKGSTINFKKAATGYLAADGNGSTSFSVQIMEGGSQTPSVLESKLIAMRLSDAPYNNTSRVICSFDGHDYGMISLSPVYSALAVSSIDRVSYNTEDKTITVNAINRNGDSILSSGVVIDASEIYDAGELQGEFNSYFEYMPATVERSAYSTTDKNVTVRVLNSSGTILKAGVYIDASEIYDAGHTQGEQEAYVKYMPATIERSAYNVKDKTVTVRALNSSGAILKSGIYIDASEIFDAAESQFEVQSTDAYVVSKIGLRLYYKAGDDDYYIYNGDAYSLVSHVATANQWYKKTS